MLTDQQIERYSRQIILPSVGGRGQERLLSASVAIVGSGEPGVTAARYLAAAGVGHLGVSEPLIAALEGLNPDCRVRPLSSSQSSSSEVVRSHDVVISAGAPPDTCLALNAACVALGKPLIWSETRSCLGQVSVFAGFRPDAPCYQCSRPPLDGEFEAADVLAGPTAALLGTVQAIESLKAILGIGTLLTGRMLAYDLRGTLVHERSLLKDPHCVCCGSGLGARAPAVVG